MAQLLRTTQARRDLEEIFDYLERANPRAAERFCSVLEHKCELLAQFPGMGRKREELAAGLLSFPVGRYIVFYRAIPDGIEIIRVLHGSRDHPPLFGRNFPETNG